MKTSMMFLSRIKLLWKLSKIMEIDNERGVITFPSHELHAQEVTVPWPYNQKKYKKNKIDVDVPEDLDGDLEKF